MRPFVITFALAQILGVQSLIVPDELPTILSVIYSNIPVLKKGTDSRIGWGFRLGNRADFQVLTELGPQTYTQPLANQEDKNTNKRNTLDSLSNTLYAQRQRDKELKRRKQEREKIISDTEGGRWLESWSKSLQQVPKEVEVEQDLPPGAQPGIAVGEIDAKSVIPDDTILTKSVKQVPKQAELEELSPSLGEIDAKSAIPDDATLKLLELLRRYLRQRNVATESERRKEAKTENYNNSVTKLPELNSEEVTETESATD